MQFVLFCLSSHYLYAQVVAQANTWAIRKQSDVKITSFDELTRTGDFDNDV